MDDERSRLAQIVASSQYLSEIIRNYRVQMYIALTDHQSVGHERLVHWCQVVAGGDWERFQTRLGWDGLATGKIGQLLQDVHPDYCHELPAWTEILRSIAHYAPRFAPNAKCEFPITPLDLRLRFPTDTVDPVPFGDVILPLLAVAQQTLFTQADIHASTANTPLLQMLSETAFLDLLRRLRHMLAKLCDKTLESELSQCRPLGQHLLTILLGETASEHRRKYYTAFVQVVLQDGMLKFFHKYPLLARLVATTIEFWVDATAEFLQRLQADREQLETIYNQWSPLGKVTAITASMSDTHSNGRTVLVVAFECGRKIVYKPRSLDLDVSYNHFLNWCN